MQKILHTPEGVRDIYNRECEQKLLLQERLHSGIRSFGYRDIETPTFEFFDVFGKEVGTIPSKELYKFFDREGNTLVLRPDFTPSIARAAARYLLGGKMAVRLTYLGNTYINNSSYQGRLKETTNIGAELIGDDSADADAEIVALVIRTLLLSGLKDFQVSLGHAGFFRSLAEEAGLEAGLVAELKQLISNKNTFGVGKLLASSSIDEKRRTAFEAIPQLFGGEEALARAEALTDCAEALAAISRLREIYRILKIYQVEQYVSFDLGNLSRYTYYTGIFFRAYTFGTGDAVVKGGRYDHLLEHFGKEAPAVGFVAVIDQLMSALSRQKISQPLPSRRCLIIYSQARLAEAIGKASDLRRDGIDVEMVRVTDERTYRDCMAYAKECSCMLYEICEEQDKVRRPEQ